MAFSSASACAGAARQRFFVLFLVDLLLGLPLLSAIPSALQSASADSRSVCSQTLFAMIDVSPMPSRTKVTDCCSGDLLFSACTNPNWGIAQSSSILTDPWLPLAKKICPGAFSSGSWRGTFHFRPRTKRLVLGLHALGNPGHAFHALGQPSEQSAKCSQVYSGTRLPK